MGAGGTVEFPGAIRASQRAEAAFEVGGRIVEFPVLEGQEVERGALLARIDDRDFVAARDADAASVKAAKADYARHEDLYANDAVSLQDLEFKRRQYEVAEATLRKSAKALEDTRLIAPFAGRVARRLVEDFENVRAKQPVVLLESSGGLEIVVSIPERDAARTRANLGEAAARDPRVEISSLPGRVFPATVKEFSTSADPVTRTFEVTLAFDPPADVQILPGMTAKLVVNDIGATGGRVMLPSQAVVASEDGSSHVWVVDPEGMTVSRRPVGVGELSGSWIEIRDGLSHGDLVATTGASHLREGMQVRRLGD